MRAAVAWRAGPRRGRARAARPGAGRVYAAPMPTPFDLALLAFIALGLPLRALWAMRRLQAAPAAALPGLRRGLYLRAMAMQWLLAAAVAALWAWDRRPWPAL